MNGRPGLSEVIDALKERGFKYSGQGEKSRAVLSGMLLSGTKHECECDIELHPDLINLPIVRLHSVPDDLKPIAPHIGPGGHLCYLDKRTVVIDIFDPVGQTIALINKAEEVLFDVLTGRMVDDLEEEFSVYWFDNICISDLNGIDLGSQSCFWYGSGESAFPVISDDPDRSKDMLARIGRTRFGGNICCYRVKTSVDPRPNVDSWPPENFAATLKWQGELDNRCRKKIVERAKQAIKEKANEVVFVVEAPGITYAFMVKNVRSNECGSAKAWRDMLSAPIIRLLVVRTDNRFVTQRNIPGKSNLFGKNVTLVGCGAIGGYLTEMLAKVGAGQGGGSLTLVDPDTFLPQNIGRHRLGYESLLKNKAEAMTSELDRSFPDIVVRALPIDVKDAHLTDIDLIIDATGEEAIGHWLCGQYLPRGVEILHTWIEGAGLACRVLLSSLSSGSCFRCLWEHQRTGGYILDGADGEVLYAGAGCDELYIPFPISASAYASALALEAALDWCNGIKSPSFRSKVIDSKAGNSIADCDLERSEKCPVCNT